MQSEAWQCLHPIICGNNLQCLCTRLGNLRLAPLSAPLLRGISPSLCKPPGAGMRRCVLGDVLDYPLAAALLQRYTSKEELRWVSTAGWVCVAVL